MADPTWAEVFDGKTKALDSGCIVHRSLPSSRYWYVTVAGLHHRAHMFAYEVTTGCEVPNGYTVHHKCETKSCVNPAHLALLPLDRHSGLHHMGSAYRWWDGEAPGWEAIDMDDLVWPDGDRGVYR